MVVKAAAYPKLADGTTTTADRIRVHDAFIVRCVAFDDYVPVGWPSNASVSRIADPKSNRFRHLLLDSYSERDESFSLPKHCDTSAVSFTVALNDGLDESCFSGGGTYFDQIADSEGHHVSMPSEKPVAVCHT